MTWAHAKMGHTSISNIIKASSIILVTVDDFVIHSLTEGMVDLYTCRVSKLTGSPNNLQ